MGTRWEERVYSYEIFYQGDTGDEVSKAIYIGGRELLDSAMLMRLVMVGLGFAGPFNELRPTIDGACISPGDPRCGARPLRGPRRPAELISGLPPPSALPALVALLLPAPLWGLAEPRLAVRRLNLRLLYFGRDTPTPLGV